jgi:hypothetical protein
MPKDYTPPGKGHTFVVPDYQDHADGVKAFEQFADSIVDGIGSGIDAPIDRDGQVIQALAKSDTDSTLEWKAGMSLRVVQDLPDDSEGDEGDVVFVLGDVPKGGGGSPAAISDHNGASVERSKEIDGKTYDIYTFTDDTRDDMTLTVETAGLADVLLVGGGGGGGQSDQNRGGGGGAGGFWSEMMYLPDRTIAVSVGSGGGSQTPGGATILARVAATPGGGSGKSNTGLGEPRGASGGGGRFGGSGAPGIAPYGNGGGQSTGYNSPGAGGGAGSAASNETPGIGRVSSITGSDVTFAVGGAIGTGSSATANTGNGGAGAPSNSTNGGAGGSGIVIVRVEV